ncbi:MAG: glycosyltransferase [Cryomorphaceae bacterium]|nr:MAG: glycosyltransferase [Cryomorphaceae bacterium]
MIDEEDLLIIFARNPVPGKVKTRLAQAIGDDLALKVYLRLLEHSHKVADELDCTTRVCYTDSIDDFGLLDYFKFEKQLQEGADLGDRMLNAFNTAFEDGFRRVVLIGSDCIELTSGILRDAFESLIEHDCVLGPATDGGYYLIGLNTTLTALFENKKWSTPDVLLDTLLDLQKADKSYFMLPTLSDIDTPEDFEKVQRLFA